MSSHIIEIPPFPDGKRLAVTFSFDDGDVADRRVVAAFNAWGLKATFNLNSARLGGEHAVAEREVGALYRGHEVASHGATHANFERLAVPQLIAEVQDDRRALENLIGYPVRGLAYPYGSHHRRVIETLRPLGLAYARTVLNAEPCFPPDEPLAWHPTMHQGPAVAERFAKITASRYSGALLVWGHCAEYRQRDAWDEFERVFKPLAGHPEAWYCTNIELFDYEEARRRLAVSVSGGTIHNPSAIPVTVSVSGALRKIPPGLTVL